MFWQNISPKSKYKSIFLESWPKFDPDMTKDDIVVIWVQVLGKLRWEIEINIEEDEKSVLEKARNNEQVAKWLDWKTIVKEIYVKWKIVNIVVK
jgi:leucyl-tRNA synthetase